MTDEPPRRGRRPGASDTRGAILAVARQKFLEHGYQAVTLRAIADEAGVDVALISYYFDSKRGLFGAAMALVANPADVLTRVLDGDPATFSVRALRALVTIWDSSDTRPALEAMVRSAAADEALAALLREMLEREVFGRIAERIGGANAQARAMAFGAQMAGIIMTRYVLRLEPIASMSVDDIVRHFGPSLRLALQGSPTRQRRSSG
ncbi:TetR/AcrR family transcriptional regulator [Streptomyces sp. NBC_00448]|uniref:TetR/AcrR family transcriptional regulator n=1 Tax=Streptomyces sp. NBC_00448 TaxID=2903652 RepID=UPI002E1D96F0